MSPSLNAAIGASRRTIIEMAEVADAGPDVEAHLHGALGGLHLSGEWYQRGPIIIDAAGLGGLRQWLVSKLPDEHDWHIAIHSPYS